MTVNKKKEYYERLTLPYIDKEGNEKIFIDQYLQGSGCELESKFWSINSSSRMAFDLYSWIVNEPSIMDFQFEKKLPGVICSNRGVAGRPNMDVYFETNTHRIFIESKYTESATMAYKKGENPNLSKAYWDINDYGGLSIKERFYGKSDIAKEFSDFCTNIQEEIDKFPKNKWKWFEAKQETCHLFGIIFYLLGATKNEERGYYCDPNNRHLDKNVCLYNVIWKFNGEEFDVDYDNSLPGIFEKKAKDLVNTCIESSINTCIESSIQFDFKILEVQKLRKETNFHGLDFTKAKAYGLNRLLENQMKQYENNQRGGLENTSSL